MRIAEKPEQFRPGELRAALILDVPGRDRQAALGGEGLQLFPRTVGVLL